MTRRYRQYDPLTFDGLRFDLPEGRVLMRSSNTEPLLRLIVEADTEALMEEKRDELLKLIRG